MIINVNSRFEPSDLTPPSTHTVLRELQGQEAALLAAGFPRRVHGLVHATDSPAVRVVVGKRSPEGLKIYKVDTKLRQVHVQVAVEHLPPELQQGAEAGHVVGPSKHGLRHVVILKQARQHGVSDALQGPLAH